MGLIDLMGTESVQKNLDGMIHNHAVWQDVAAQLNTQHSAEKFAAALHFLSETQEAFPVFFLDEIYGFVFQLRGTVLTHKI